MDPHTHTHSKGPGTPKALPRTRSEGMVAPASAPAGVRMCRRRGCRRRASRNVQQHICPEKKGGPEPQALVFLLGGVRGHLCRLALVWRKPGFGDEIQMWDHFAGCQAETFSRSWRGRAGSLVAAACARGQQLFRAREHTGPPARASSSSSASQPWLHQGCQEGPVPLAVQIGPYCPG